VRREDSSEAIVLNGVHAQQGWSSIFVLLGALRVNLSRATGQWTAAQDGATSSPECELLTG